MTHCLGQILNYVAKNYFRQLCKSECKQELKYFQISKPVRHSHYRILGATFPKFSCLVSPRYNTCQTSNVVSNRLLKIVTHYILYTVRILCLMNLILLKHMHGLPCWWQHQKQHQQQHHWYQSEFYDVAKITTKKREPRYYRRHWRIPLPPKPLHSSNSCYHSKLKHLFFFLHKSSPRYCNKNTIFQCSDNFRFFVR